MILNGKLTLASFNYSLCDRNSASINFSVKRQVNLLLFNCIFFLRRCRCCYCSRRHRFANKAITLCISLQCILFLFFLFLLSLTIHVTSLKSTIVSWKHKQLYFTDKVSAFAPSFSLNTQKAVETMELTE